jgi:hypothetical protein
MAAHARQPTAWLRRLLAAMLGLGLLFAPAAVAAPSRVPDESALTEYVPLLPDAEGPVVAGRSDAGDAAPDLPAATQRRLSELPARRAAALRRLARSYPLGASPAARHRVSLATVKPSVPAAVRDSFSAWSIVLALGLVAGVIAAAAARRYRATQR